MRRHVGMKGLRALPSALYPNISEDRVGASDLSKSYAPSITAGPVAPPQSSFSPPRGLRKRPRRDYSEDNYYEQLHVPSWSEDSWTSGECEDGADSEGEDDPEGRDDSEGGDDFQVDDNMEDDDEGESDNNSERSDDSDDVIDVVSPVLLALGDHNKYSSSSEIRETEHDARGSVGGAVPSCMVTLFVKAPNTNRQAARDDSSGFMGIRKGAAPRLATLSIKISRTYTVRFAVTENVLRQVPAYAQQLDTAIAENEVEHRLYISDLEIRKEEPMFQVIEYLTYGILKPLKTEDPDACFDSLLELLELYDLSAALDIKTLALAVVQHLDQSGKPDLPNFVAFAIECFRYNSGHAVTADCPMWLYIKRMLSKHLNELKRFKLTEDLRDAGGILSKLLIDALLECGPQDHT
ncbi:hypothetical protein BDY17DRAFT_148517 [Neohortaea acidophila]|uniref:BTB domain-containing protein n=1 Tax=Neohortaea acidophila TaxID=245834 RepID=A0A6A6PUU8_9PEZI|nr:uncharacterized protein BDY17DRAFT_148517 [Neohortaea acidophila]KAF2483481.1 hypothetical protein BDY17DRAFT_148517 [Neohortaea acidophila]